MVAHRAGRKFYTVADKIILIRRNRERVNLAALGGKQCIEASRRHRERIMAEFQFSGFLSDFVHREVDNPAERILLLIHVTGDCGSECFDENTGCLLGKCLLTCGNSDEITGGKAKLLLYHVCERRYKLGDTSDKRSVLIDAEPVRLAAGLHFHIRKKPVDHLPAALEAGYNDCLDNISLKRAKTAAAEDFGRILHRQVNPQVRFIGTVFLHRFQIRNPFERCAARSVVFAEFSEYRRQNIFKYRKNIFLRRKRHLHIQLIELSRRTVTSGVFVTEARRDLEITVEACCHKQLLELLRCLRQRVKFSGVLTCGHKIVSRAFRRRRGQNRRCDLEEAMLCHCLPERGYNIAS